MNRILSWKIDAGVYAYIYLPNSLTHISSRITENSPLWADILNEVSTWDEPAYRSHFDEMADEIKQRYGVILTYQANFFNFVDENAVNGTNIVILAGEDGTGGNSNGIFGGGTGDAAAVYDEFLAAIDAKLAAARSEILAENNAVRDFLEDTITNTISEAQKTIEETKEELDATREEMTGRLDDATDALNKAAELFELGDGNIDGEAIKQAFNSLEDIEEWMDTYSGSMIDMKTDYDAANQMMGQIGTGEDVTRGCFSKMASAMNVLSGTVGTVRTDLDAANGTISNIASWYDQYASAATEAAQFISASAATIENNVKYVTEGGINSQITSTIDGMKGEIRDAVLSETQAGITNVQQTLNSFSASISTEIAHLAPDSALTSMGERMDALNAHMSEWMTVTDSAMSMTMDLREDWSVESGKMSTVSSMIAETNADGTPIYYVSAETGTEIVVTKIETGEFVDTDGNVYPPHRGYVHYGEMLASYIKQTASSMTLSVMNEDNMTAAIKLAIVDSGDGPDGIITMVAEEVVIDADIIAKAISAKSANIGGVILDYGSIYCMATTPSALGEYYYSTTYVSSSFTHDESGNVLSSYTYNVTLLDGEPEDFSTTAATTEENILRIDFTTYTTDKYPLKYMKGYYYEPLFKLDGLNGVLYAGDARIRGSISADTGSIGDTVINNGNIESTKKDEEGNSMFVINGSEGKITAKDVDIAGSIQATSGSIGGFVIADNMFKATGADKNLVSFINGSDRYASDEDGKLIIGAGINSVETDTVTMYEWTCLQDPDYTTVYTTKPYQTNDEDDNSYTTNEIVVAYRYSDEDGKFVELPREFYYIREFLEDTDTQDDDVALLANGGVIYTDENGDSVIKHYSEYIVRRYMENETLTESQYTSAKRTKTGTGVMDVNTRIFSNGVIETNSIYASNGWYAGQIESDGTFRGILDYATGKMTGATIGADLLYGNVVLNNNNYLRAQSGDSPYFEISSTNQSSLNTNVTYDISKVYLAGKYNRSTVLSDTVRVANFSFGAGASIFIDTVKVTHHVSIPRRRTGFATCQLRAYVTYEGQSRQVVTPDDWQSYTFPPVTGKMELSRDKDFPAFTMSNLASAGTFTLEYFYLITMPDNYNSDWSNLKRHELNVNNAKIRVRYDRAMGGIYIAPNGFKCITPAGAAMYAIDKTVMLLSPNRNFGIEITDNGITKISNGTRTPL